MAGRWLACADRDQAGRSVAQVIGTALRKALQQRERARLVLSGGSTPLQAFEWLSAAQLDWSRVDVLPSDERCVAVDHPDSNAGMLRARLLQGPAAAARLHALYRPGTDAAADTAADIAVLRPFDCVLLGMGADGHFASLFPDFEDLDEALDLASPETLVNVRTAASPHPRLSLTLAALCDTTCMLLLIFGADKRAVYETAATGDPRLPISALLTIDNLPLTTVWAP